MNKIYSDKKILLVYPRYKETFWSFGTVLKIIGKKAAYPPLGLLTVSAMLPKKWEKKLIDMNCEILKDEDIKWADYIFISAMLIQKESTKKVISKVQSLGKPVVAGGPLFTTGYEDFPEVDHLVLGEAEDTLQLFLDDLKKGSPKKIYFTEKFPNITKSPVPDWSLINASRYNSLSIQYSRGCPFNCEFCDVVRLNGRIPRYKTTEQIINELEALYNIGWQNGVFFVDDNFIGNKKNVKKEILPAIIDWQKKKGRPFTFNTQASINLADDDKLMKLMVKAGITAVFVGIETPDTDSLKETGKLQNVNRDLLQSVKKIQNIGMEVQAGFIVGFDCDRLTIFQRQIDFIQKSGIVTAMVSVLTALPKTRLYERLVKTNRLTKEATGNNTKSSELNFIPKMGVENLLNGHQKILDAIYSPRLYYERIKTFTKQYKPMKGKMARLRLYHIKAFFTSIWVLGIKRRGRFYYWKLFIWSFFRHPKLFPYVIGMSVIGMHFSAVS